VAYRASKTTINQQTVTLARELQTQGSKVTINAIDPGWIPTNLSNWTGPDDLDVQTTHMVDTISNRGADTARFMNVKGEDYPF
jgi:NAD(P)-dependent dehydrogenase (short-subunit alcohol dehydrogenase family)